MNNDNFLAGVRTGTGQSTNQISAVEKLAQLSAEAALKKVRPAPAHSIIQDSGRDNYMNRILIGTAATGSVRIEWVNARYSVTLPVNWSQVDMVQPIPTYIPLRYLVADAQNLIVKHCLEHNFEWLLFLEHDVVIQPDTMIRFNEYMLRQDTPIVSGLYFTRSHPSQPLVFRGRGSGVYADWQMGDKVMCDGIPTGLLLIHTSILREMWKDSEEYNLQGQVTRRVFNTPRDMWFDPEKGSVNRSGGTSDLDWCKRVMDGDYLRKAGWDAYVDGLEDERYPFVCDTNIFAQHITVDGQRFP